MKKTTNIVKAAVVIAIALAFLLPGAAIAINTDIMAVHNNPYTPTSRSGEWTVQASGFYEPSIGIRYLDALNENVAWAVGYDGSGGNIYRTWFTKTGDGGENWEADEVIGDEGYGLGNICGIDADTAWAALFYAGAQDDSCGIYKTTDGGDNWVHQEGPLQGAASFANNVFFWNENDGVCQGDVRDGYFEVYTTTNGGDDWTRVPEEDFSGDPPESGEAGWTGVIDIVGDTVLFGTNKGNMWKSDDKGLTWTVSFTGIGPGGLNEGVNQIAFKDSDNGLAAHDNGQSYDLYATSDGGDNWEQITPTGFVYSAGLSYVPGTDNMYVSTGAAQEASGASYSFDGGQNWIEYSEMFDIQMLECDFVEGQIGWAGGFNQDEVTGGMFKHIPGDPEPAFAVSFADEEGLTVTIANVGTAAATNVAYVITIEGGFIVLPAKEFTGSFDSIESGESESFALGLKGIGLGVIFQMPKVTVTVTCDEEVTGGGSDEFRLFLTKVTLQ